MAEVPQAFTDYLNQLSNNIINTQGTVKYNPYSASTLKSVLSKAMRPSYDQAIQQRQTAGQTNKANIDADAAARGIGSSTWVTDAKNRQQDAEAKDIAGIEGDYNNALYNALWNRMAQQDEMSMAAQQANAQLKANALNSAMNPAWQLYQQSIQPTGGGGGYSRGTTKPKPEGDDTGLDQFGNIKNSSLPSNLNHVVTYGNTGYYNPETGTKSGSTKSQYYKKVTNATK